MTDEVLCKVKLDRPMAQIFRNEDFHELELYQTLSWVLQKLVCQLERRDHRLLLVDLLCRCTW